MKFLLGVDVVPDSDSDAVPADLSEQRRKWPLSQAKEFGELHRALARFVSACNLDQQREFKGTCHKRDRILLQFHPFRIHT